MEISSDALIVVVGAGTMGAGIAQVAAAAKHSVYVIDERQAALTRGQDAVSSSLAGLVRRGILDSDGQAAIQARITWSLDWTGAAHALLAIEAIVEDLDAKISALRALAEVVPVTCIIATNTSSLSINALAKALPHPERFIGLHFFNPVPAMRLVEVIPAEDTTAAASDAAVSLMQRWGKHSVFARDQPGFIVNRVARPYYAEAFVALIEGVEACVIDHALTAGAGFRMGPLALADLIGHDINYTVAASVFDAYHGHTRFRPQPAQLALVESGRLGRKTGLGVYDYAHALPQPSFAPPAPPPGLVTAASHMGPVEPLIAAARRAGVEVRIDSTLAPGTFDVDGITIALGDGRRLRSRAGTDVLLDPARDFEVTSTLILTTDDERARAAAAGFAQANGRSALFVPDRPGQIVLRTLAQLANAAADAVRDGVAGPDQIDEAMVFGANHPEGPLRWAARIGPAVVAEILRNVAAATGDAIYRPSSFFDAPAGSGD